MKSSLIASLAATLATLLHAAAQNPVITAPIRPEGVALYTVQNGVMKMTAQLYPLAANAPQ